MCSDQKSILYVWWWQNMLKAEKGPIQAWLLFTIVGVENVGVRL